MNKKIGVIIGVMFCFASVFANVKYYPLYKESKIQQTPNSLTSQYSNIANAFFPIYTKNNMYNLKNWNLIYTLDPRTAPFYLLRGESYPEEKTEAKYIKRECLAKEYQSKLKENKKSYKKNSKERKHQKNNNKQSINAYEYYSAKWN